MEKEVPQKSIHGWNFRDDSALKPFLKKARKARGIIIAAEKKPEDEVFSLDPTPYLYLCNFGAGCAKSDKLVPFLEQVLERCPFANPYSLKAFCESSRTSPSRGSW